ncbi:MAG: permease, partial [Spartobacteria bacterium]|nr:permease [Spartobacteria bacterium]
MTLYHAVVMLWETFWALVLGFGVSAALQSFVSKEQMSRLFGRTNLKTMLLATGLGAASSSCSYAAAAAGRSAFKQGAAFIPALAFMFASTNLVIELGAVLWLFMGWRFVLAEIAGAFVLIGCMWLLASLFLTRQVEEEA